MQFCMSAEEFRKEASKIDGLQLLCEVSENRFVARASIDLLEIKPELAVRWKAPTQDELKAMVDNITKYEMLYSPICIVQNRKLVILDGIQRYKVAKYRGVKSIEVTILTGIEQDHAYQLAASANGVRFAQEDTDLLRIMKVIKDDKVVASVARVSDKTVGRYRKLIDADLDQFVIMDKEKDRETKLFQATFALRLLTECKNDAKLNLLKTAINKQKQYAEAQIATEKLTASEKAEKKNKKKLEYLYYFNPKILARWEDALIDGIPLPIGITEDLVNPFKEPSRDDWNRGVPRFGIEGRKWTDFGADQFGNALDVLERIKIEIESRKLFQKRQEMDEQQRQKRKGKNLGIAEDNQTFASEQQDLPEPKE